MDTLLVLSTLVSGFGYALLACGVGAALAYAFSDELGAMLAMAIDYDGLDVEEIATIEEVRAELARRAREKRANEQSAAFEKYAARALYMSAAEGDWREATATRARSLTLAELLAVSGVGPKRARRIVDAGEALTWEVVRAVCGPQASVALAASV